MVLSAEVVDRAETGEDAGGRSGSCYRRRGFGLGAGGVRYQEEVEMDVADMHGRSRGAAGLAEGRQKMTC